MTKTILTFLITLLTAATVFNQIAPPTDPVTFFDERKVWYNGFTETWFRFDFSDEEVRDSIVHWEQIGKDLSVSSSKDLSGFYLGGGETHGEYLRLSEKSGFVWLHVNKCLGGPVRILRGKVQMTVDGVILLTDVSLGSSSGHEEQIEHGKKDGQVKMFAVKWRGSTYLVRESSLKDFADYAAGLGEYNQVYQNLVDYRFLSMRGSDENSMEEASELPQFPSSYTHLVERPVRGEVISIGNGTRRKSQDSDVHDDHVTRLQVRLDSGANAGEGIYLFAVGEEQAWSEKFLLISIKKNIAVVEHIRPIPKRNCSVSSNPDCEESKHIKLKKGLILSSNTH